MTRFLNGPVVAMFLAAACALTAYVLVTGAQTRRSAALTEGEVRDGYARSVKRAFTPRGSISAKQDHGASPSVNVAYRRHSYPVDFRHRWILEKAHRLRTNTKLSAEHAHVQRLLRELRHVRTVQAHVEPPVAWPWVAIVDCETGDGDGRPPYAADWPYNGSSGFDGGPQFEPGTWTSYRHAGEPERAYEASPSVQIAVAERVLADQGWAAWPACSSKVGLR